MTVRMRAPEVVVCDLCKTSLTKILDEFEPAGTFYHPMNSWWADMRPQIIESKTACPNAGKKFRLQWKDKK